MPNDLVRMFAFVLAVALTSADPECGRLCAPETIQHYRRLLASAGWGLKGEERAAFLRLSPSGKLLVEQWPTGGLRGVSFRGKMPARVIAVMHTHPLREPWPSDHDRAEARRIGLPVIVITPGAVTVARPDGTVGQLSSTNSRPNLYVSVW